jgi:hypothetical protein
VLFVLLNILTNASVVMLLRETGRRGFGLLPVIAVNYWVCSSLGAGMTPGLRDTLSAAPANAVFLGIGLGLLFIGVFTVIGLGADKMGVGYTGMISKISVIIPVGFAYFYLGETIVARQWWGLALVPPAIVLLHADHFSGRRATSVSPTTALFIGSVIFFGSGASDTAFKYYQATYEGRLPISAFLFLIFCTAGLCGGALLFSKVVTGNRTLPPLRRMGLTRPAVLVGAMLGGVNFFSIYTLIKALEAFEAAVAFPLMNVGLLTLLTVLGTALYGEKRSAYAWAGVAASMVAIALLV